MVPIGTIRKEGVNFDDVSGDESQVTLSTLSDNVLRRSTISKLVCASKLF